MKATILVKRTERGWPGHFCSAFRCQFRRNTLLECDGRRIVVSTVGRMTVGTGTAAIDSGRFYETRAFEAKWAEDEFWDADVTRPVPFESAWSISAKCADSEANAMHDRVVAEIDAMLLKEALAR